MLNDLQVRIIAGAEKSIQRCIRGKQVGGMLEFIKFRIDGICLLHHALVNAVNNIVPDGRNNHLVKRVNTEDKRNGNQ